MERGRTGDSGPGQIAGPIWRAAAVAHAAAVDELTGRHRARRGAGRDDPVEDFLFTYYRFRPGQLRQWSPGAGVVLLDAEDRAGLPFHRRVPAAPDVGCPTQRRAAGDGVTVDVAALVAGRRPALTAIGRLLLATSRSPAQWGCFGLHEWAMVYRDDGGRRHPQQPLRLTAAATDEIVRSHRIRCTHHDAFRFFTPAARELNVLRPAADNRELFEQPGCLHVTMDLYKWAYKLLPLVSSDLVMRCFSLARRVRRLDMRASPYDLTAQGLTPVAIESAQGKAEYVAAQKQFAAEGAVLRAELLAATKGALQPARSAAAVGAIGGVGGGRGAQAVLEDERPADHHQ